MDQYILVTSFWGLLMMLNHQSFAEEAITFPPDCQNNDDCNSVSLCTNHKCIDPCKSGVCGKNSLCHVKEHIPLCTCQQGYTGHPFTGCYDASQVLSCAVNEDCESDKVCKEKTCIDPCQQDACSQDTVCFVKDHLILCICQSGFSGDPLSGCYLSTDTECTSNSNCSDDKMCVHSKCEDPCNTAECGDNTLCQTHHHTAVCSCKPGYSGSPITGCQQGQEIKSKKKFIMHTHKEMTWQQSFDHCTSVGMKLATVNSQDEQDTLLRVIRDNLSCFWIGGSDLGDTGGYMWKSTNTPLTYTNWWKGEPNNFKNSYIEVDHCVVVCGAKGKWYDDYCSATWHALCEHYD